MKMTDSIPLQVDDILTATNMRQGIFVSERVKYFFLILSLVYITNLYITTTDYFLVLIFLVAGIYFHYKGLKYDPGIFLIIIFFLLINFASVLFYGMFKISTLVGMVLRLLIPYYVIKILQYDFIIIFENTIYFFAILSIPFYLLQFIKPDVYLLLNPFFQPFNTDLRYNAQAYSYLIHTVHYDILYRNCGIAWEPGAFGYILGIGIMFNIVRSNYVFTKQALILTLVGLTTLSTTFYIFIIALLSFYLYERKRNVVILYFALPIFTLAIIYMSSLPFMSEKIASSFKTQNSNVLARKNLEATNESGAGRFGGVLYEYQRISEYPFGYGINTSTLGINKSGELISGPVGLANFTRIWGVLGLLYLIFIIYNISNKLAIIYNNKNKIFIMFTILLFCFSNPLEREPIFLMLVYFSIFLFRNMNQRLLVNSQ